MVENEMRAEVDKLVLIRALRKSWRVAADALHRLFFRRAERKARNFAASPLSKASARRRRAF